MDMAISAVCVTLPSEILRQPDPEKGVAMIAILCTPGVSPNDPDPGYYLAVEAPHPFVQWCSGLPAQVVLAAQDVPAVPAVASPLQPDLFIDAEPDVSPRSFVAGPFAEPQDALDWYLATYEAPTAEAAVAADALAALWQAHDPLIATYFRWLADDRRAFDGSDARPSGLASS